MALRLILFILLGFLFLTDPLCAQSISLDLGEGPSVTTRFIQLLALTSILALAPSILVMTTSFTRIVVVFSFLRNALGLQQSPPNTVIISLALFLTAFIMGPTLEKAYESGVKPYMAEEITEEEAWEKSVGPIQEFMLKHVREKDLGLFMDIAKVPSVNKASELPLKVLVPAFMISELKRAFEIGFLLFIPFLIIDMVVASVLMSMGMMMLPPVTISLPFKIIFFVLIDGWHLVAGSLIQSYGGG
ncbi:Flagellar type III secretion system pore protein FliP [Candidatus Bealeia paramacronuclearis]|uniref:Flagellar biosynthetic protein FliP n=1 Tax=Candidatus Bealeia paramacronuclearis TaxID=1921001 RepID=A0ABZ2C1T1_9PROT|nr:Flagellar type III secretion system pore protein FliP [Candidatus Bealeia paramacronuclearis]